MDPQALKVFAERLRAYLNTQQLALKHGQVLDLVAALPGLRNWPEVSAFPNRVAAATLNDHAAGRLARRIHDRFSLSVSPAALLQALAPPTNSQLKVWPDGPTPGVYVTTSQSAIDAAVARYEAATEGAILYAEDAGSGSDSAIDLGEMGLFSGGMERLPSGTLVVVGPLELTQDGWEDSCNRLNVAANLAYFHSLRIAALVRTPSLQNLYSDIDLLLRPEGEGLDTPLVDTLGIVTQAGDMQVVMPFVASRSKPVAEPISVTDQRLPEALESALADALKIRPFGILLFGVSPFSPDERMELMEAVLPLTDHAGPAVRIQDHFRSSEKPLSPALDALPVYPSVESAYAHGFRRMVIRSSHGNAVSAMLAHADDTCFLVAARDAEVSGMWVRSSIGRDRSTESLKATIAVMSVSEVAAKGQAHLVCDVITSEAISRATEAELEEMFDFFAANRVVRWEDQLEALLRSGKVTTTQAKKTLRFHPVEEYLSSRGVAQAV